MFLEIKGIKKHYGEGESRVEVLNGIDIEVNKGEIVVLLGPSGSGKSTLLNIIGGIDDADEGYISIDICAFKDGRVAKFGTVDEVMTKEVLSEIYNVDFEIMNIQGRPLSIYY